jgi:hypothetical protein
MSRSHVYGAGLVLALMTSISCRDTSAQGELLGTAQEAFVAVATENSASITGQTSTSPSAAWIRSSVLPSNGEIVVGYTENGVAAWSHASQWATAATNWKDMMTNDPHRSDDMAPFGWPAPEDFCTVYFCPDAKWGSYSSVAQALWTGLDDVAAIVAVGGTSDQPNTDVTIVTSIDGGKHFTKSKILTLSSLPRTGFPFPSGDPGGDIDPTTVHASLMYAPERTSALAGVESVPIYVIWKNLNEQDGNAWFMTKVVVGVDGAIVQAALPTKVTAIPDGSVGHASILGYEDEKSNEVVDIAWSQITDSETEEPIVPSACPSTQTVQVDWFETWTQDFGANWGCYPAGGGTCSGSPIAVDFERFWRPCVGSSFGTGATNPNNVNNDRPEFVMSRGDTSFLYIANNKRDTHTMTNEMHVHVWRAEIGAMGGFVEVFTSAARDSDSTEIAESWGQSMAVIQGDLTHEGLAAVSWRNADTTSKIWMDSAISAVIANFPGPFDINEHVLTTSASSGVPWNPADAMGLYTGMTAQQPCLYGSCPSGQATPEHTAFLTVWPDLRTLGYKTEIWGRAFKFAP